MATPSSSLPYAHIRIARYAADGGKRHEHEDNWVEGNRDPRAHISLSLAIDDGDNNDGGALVHLKPVSLILALLSPLVRSLRVSVSFSRRWPETRLVHDGINFSSFFILVTTIICRSGCGSSGRGRKCLVVVFHLTSSAKDRNERVEVCAFGYTCEAVTVFSLSVYSFVGLTV